MEEENFRAVMLYCFRRGLRPIQIHNEMFGVYGESTPSLITVRRWVRRFEEGNMSLEDEPRSGRPRDLAAVELVREHLADNPYATLGSITAALTIPHTTVLRILTERLGLKKFVSRWVPHKLTPEQKDQRACMAQQLLHTLSSMTERQLGGVITGDESWFYHSYPHNGRWASESADVPPREMIRIDTPRTLIVVMWGLRGALVVDALDTGVRYNAQYVVDTLLPKMEAAAALHRPSMKLHGMHLHWDNARPHTATATQTAVFARGLRLLPHPPYSPDLAPSDFFLFGYLKHRLLGQSFENPEGLILAVRQLISEIPRSLLMRVFEEWKIRLERVVEVGGDYYV